MSSVAPTELTSPLVRASTVALLLALPGCYSYRPTTLEALAPGAEMRAQLDDEGARTMEDFTGRRAERVDGSLVRRDAHSVLFEVWRTDLGDGFSFQPGRVQVPLERQDVVEVASRRFSYLRTAALAGGVGGGLYLLIKGIWDAAGGSLSGPGGGGGI